MFSTMLIALAVLLWSIEACSTIGGVKITFFGYPDNSPPGAGTAFDCGNRNYQAGGIGTYDDPLTFATDSTEYAPCEIVYIPYLEKYLRMEDDCQQCETDWASGIAHIDVWAGSSRWNGGQDQIDCEVNLTPESLQSIIRQPAKTLDVDSTAVYDHGTCNTDHTYLDYEASDYCGNTGAGGSTATASATATATGSGSCQSGCTWEGHCIGCPCTDYNDCSDDYICSNGQCAAQ